jgi:hypothetical protein
MGSISVIDNCPDGLDCPNYNDCAEHKSEDDPCPLGNPYFDHDVPLDKIIKSA